MGYIVGERFDDYVLNQIVSRQKIQGAGYLGGTRNANQMQLLTNKNAWLKCASSVFVDPQSDDEKLAQLDGYSNKYPKAVLPENFNPISLGEARLRQNNLTPVEDFTGTQLARKAVLFNTLSELSNKSYSPRSGVTNAKFSNESNNFWNQGNSYGLGGSDFGLNPAPGLISFTVNSQNRGSIRKGTLTLKAYNKFQFQLIELLYLRLGYSMLVEWGWDKYSLDGGKTIKNTGNSIIEDQWFNDGSCNSQLDMIRLIDKYRSKYGGNYDGFFGRVENFQWEFNSNGTYDIQIFLVTVGAVVESLQVTTKTEVLTDKELKKLTASLAEKEGEKVVDSSIVSRAGDNQLSQDLFIDIASSDVFNGSNNNYINVSRIFGQNIFKNDDKEKNTQTLSRYNYFLSFGELLDKVKKSCIPVLVNKCETANDLILNIDNEPTTNLCAAYPNQVAIDPRICIIKPIIQEPIGDKIEFNLSQGWSKLKPFGTLENVSLSTKTGNQESTIIYGNIMNIYLNYEFISQCLSKVNVKGELNLYNFLTDICNGINKSLGYINNLEVVIVEDKIIKIIDQNPIVGVEESKDARFANNKPIPNPLFEIFGYNPSPGVKDPNNPDNLITSPFSNFVKDFKFTTRISPGTATTIAVGATAAGTSTKNYDGTAFSKWNEGLIDRYQMDVIDPRLSRVMKEINDIGSRFNELGLNVTQNIDAELAIALYDNYNSSKIDLTVSETLSTWWSFAKAAASNYSKYAPTGIVSGVISYNKKQSEILGAKDTTKALNVEFKGPRFVPSINGLPDFSGAFQSVTWAEYVQKVEDFLIVKKSEDAKITLTELFDKFSTNWDFWIASSLGGTFNGIEFKNGTDNEPTYWDYNDINVKNGFNSFKAYINALHNFIYEKYRQPSSTIGFIPADLNAQFEGLSGIKIYNALQIRQEILPPQYPETLKFLISTVDHEISENNWTTSINTLSVPNISLVPGKFAFAELTEAVRSYNTSIGAVAEYSGATPNADLLRVFIAENNEWLTEKQSGKDGLGGLTSNTISGGELSSGGDITREMAEQAIIMFSALHREYPDLKFEITAGNDLYHFNTPGAKNSRHRRGLAIDFTLQNQASQNDIDKVADVLGGFIANPSSNLWYLNEYKDMVDYASGFHFHVSLDRREPSMIEEKVLADNRFKELGEAYYQPKDSDLNAINNLPEPKSNFDYRIVGKPKYIRNKVIVGTTTVGGGKFPTRIYKYGVKAEIIIEIDATKSTETITSVGGNANATDKNETGYYKTIAAALASAKSEATKKTQQIINNITG